jgi:arylsulfatase A-like enzyme
MAKVMISMPKDLFSTLFVAMGLVAVATGGRAAQLETTEIAGGEMMNIVVFLVDDMGVMDTSVAFLTDRTGAPQRHPLNDWYRTPNMQRLADIGIRFSDFYAMNACSPTRISIMSGQNSTRHRTTNYIAAASRNRGEFDPPHWNWEGFAKEDTTLPRLLQARGYRTIHVGKGHFGPVNRFASDPKNLGFDVNIGGSAWGHHGSYFGVDSFGNLPKFSRPAGVPHLEKYHGSDTFLTEALTIEARSQIAKAAEDDRPFFL